MTRQTPGNQRFSIIPARAVTDLRVTPALLRTLALIGTYGDKDGWCFPSLRLLGTTLAVSPQAISKNILRLVELGYLEVRPRYRKDGGRTSNEIRLRFDSTPPQPLEVEAPSTSKKLRPPQPLEVEGSQPLEVEGSSLTSYITPHINDAPVSPKNGDTGLRAARPKPKTTKPVPAPRPRDAIFDAIAECSFGIPVSAEVAKDTAARIGKVKRELLTTFPALTAEQLRAAYGWHTDTENLTAPRDPAKVVTMVGVYRAKHAPPTPPAPVEMVWHEPEMDYEEYYSPEAMQARADRKAAEMMGIPFEESTDG